MTSSIKWEPIEDVKALRKLLERSFAGKMSAKLAGARPLMDLFETDEAFVAEIEVPGLITEDIDVSVSGSQVTVEIERRVPEGRVYVLVERLAGKMSRTIDLPDVVDADKVQARLKDGVLVLTMPKCKDAQEIKIAVSSGGE
jgi:HSP20 family protein